MWGDLANMNRAFLENTSASKLLGGHMYLPYEIHVQILSYLDIEDQAAASITGFQPWQQILSQSEVLQKLRYNKEKPFLSDEFHPFMNYGRNWLGITVRGSKIEAYNLYKLRLLDTEVLKRPGRYKYTRRGNELVSFCYQRLYSDFENPRRKVDISSCSFLDEPFLSPYEDSQGSPALESYFPYNPNRGYTNRIREKFPVVVTTSVGYPSEAVFHVFRVSGDEILGFTLRRFLLFIARRLEVILGGYLECQPEVDINGGPQASDNDFGLRMDPNKKYELFVHQKRHDKEIGVQVLIVPCDDEERSYVINTISRRRKWKLQQLGSMTVSCV
ncbi:hypothetical protein TWF694_002075 [Orbilia ellipsospora]|uniref:F-box domain-containing protein n=1 Tax=Orbilia ellipsospora TaxID=2528407 RepID=A0AAV9X4H1_9PEZI